MCAVEYSIVRDGRGITSGSCGAVEHGTLDYVRHSRPSSSAYNAGSGRDAAPSCPGHHLQLTERWRRGESGGSGVQEGRCRAWKPEGGALERGCRLLEARHGRRCPGTVPTRLAPPRRWASAEAEPWQKQPAVGNYTLGAAVATTSQASDKLRAQATRSESKRGRGSGERRSTLRRIFFPSFSFVSPDGDSRIWTPCSTCYSRWPHLVSLSDPIQAQSPLSRVLPRGRPLRGEAQGENWRSRRLLWCVLACRTRLSSARTVFVGTPGDALAGIHPPPPFCFSGLPALPVVCAALHGMRAVAAERQHGLGWRVLGGSEIHLQMVS